MRQVEEGHVELFIHRIALVQLRHHLTDREAEMRLEVMELLLDRIGELRVVRGEVLVVHE